jgi:hypothetical protein
MWMHYAEVYPMSHQRLKTAQISDLFAIAGYMRRNTTEVERVEAVNSLLGEYLLQIEEFKRGERDALDPLLREGIEDWGRRIFAQEDPVTALARFLGKRQRPGKRAKHTARDFNIAVAVVIKMKDGMPLEEAASVIAAEHPSLKEETIRKIYVQNQKAAKAHFGLCRLQGLPPLDVHQAE